VKDRFLEQFLAQIAPSRHLWRSARLVGYAGLLKGVWILLGGRVVLSTKNIQSEVLTKVANFPEFLAFVDEFPLEGLDMFLRTTIQSENLNLNLGGKEFRDISLQADKNNTVSWHQPAKFGRSHKSVFGLDSVGFQWTIFNSLQLSQIGAMELLERVSEQLRLESDRNGVEALSAEYTPGLNLNFSLCPQLQIVAPIPFELKDAHGRGICLTIPETADPPQIRLKAFFRKSSRVIERLVSLEDYPMSDGAFTISWDFEWPEGTSCADVRLFYGGREIDSLTINKWVASASIRGAIDDYFDGEHKLLRKALAWQDKAKSADFELAVVRLLNLLGIPAVWYGKGADADRPDAAALLGSEGSNNVALLIECTREKPVEKFAPLTERAHQLVTSIGGDATVLPVVFTPIPVIGADIAAATQHGVCLVGTDELAHLLELLTLQGVTPDLVLHRLRERNAVAAAEQFVGRW
jgi:hypothetical protein